MKTRGTQFLTIVATLLIMMTALASTAGAQNAAAGKGYGTLNPDGTVTENGVNPAFGFPDVYRDANGLELALCLDGAPYCLASTTDGGPAHINTGPDDATPTNFPDEAFWWSAGATLDVPGGGRANLVLAMEAAFATVVRDGDQMSFGRVRVKATNLVPAGEYTFVHPYGRITEIADERGTIFFTDDVGCFPNPRAGRACDFNDALFSDPATAFLVWDETQGDAAPAGYVGDPNVGHAVKGSPTGNNFFRIVGEDPATGDAMTLETTDFFVEGKLATAAAVKCGDPGAPTDPDVCPVGPVDTTAPQVSTFSPTGNTVARGANIVVTFSEPVTGVGGNSVQLQAGNRKVAATVTLSANGRQAVLNPRQPLAAGTRYRVTLTSRITDEAGNALPVKSWAFKTR